MRRSRDSSTEGEPLPSQLLLLVLPVILPRGRPVAVNLPNIGAFQNVLQRIRHNIADARIARACDDAGRDHIPDSDMIPEQKRLLLFHGLRHLFPAHGCRHFPETVLRMVP